MSYGVNLHQAEAGKKSIGAVATEKVQSDALNLGYPAAYQSVYASKQIAPRFFPDVAEAKHRDFWRGSDLQSHIHEERRKDADYMAGAKVRSTQISRVRFVGTPHGKGDLPPAVLGQRIFANINNGAYSATSARQSHSAAPFHYANSSASTESQHRPLSRDAEGFHQNPLVDGGDLTGGVLRSMEGQKYGRKLLQSRIQQLNDIQTAKQEFQTGAPLAAPTPQERMASATETPVSGENPAIELNLLLQGVVDAVIGGEEGGDINHLSGVTYKDSSRALALLFRLAPAMDNDALDDAMGKVDLIVNGLQGILDPSEDTTLPVAEREIGLTLQVLFTKVRAYLENMSGAVTRSVPERVALSKALVNTLGFSKMLKYGGDNYQSLLSTAAKENLMNAQQYQRYRVGDMGVDGEGSDFDEDDDDNFFDRPVGPREDDAHDAETGYSRSARDFTPDVRQEFGTQSGMFYPSGGRGPSAYFNEAIYQEMGGPQQLGDVTVAPDVPLTDRQYQELPLEARPPPSRSASVSSAAVAAARASAAAPVSSFWDPDTQAFNVSSEGMRAPPPSRATSVRASVSTPRSRASSSAAERQMRHDIRRGFDIPSRTPTASSASSRTSGRESGFSGISGKYRTVDEALRDIASNNDVKNYDEMITFYTEFPDALDAAVRALKSQGWTNRQIASNVVKNEDAAWSMWDGFIQKYGTKDDVKRWFSERDESVPSVSTSRTRGTMYPSSSSASTPRAAPRAAPAPAAVPRAAPAPFALPTRQSQLPTTREGYDALAKAINAAGGINGSYIQVYAGSNVSNIRRNFIKRLGLAGKY